MLWNVMTTGNLTVLEAFDALRKAIHNMPDGAPAPTVPFFVQWKTVGRHYLSQWVDDLEATVAAAVSSRTDAAASGLSATGAKDLEHSLWRLDAAVDKLVKTLALTLGVGVLQLNQARNGVVFRLDPRQVSAKLKELSATSQASLKLYELLQQLREHPSRDLRNDVSHSLSPIGNPTPLVHFAVVYSTGGHHQLPQARMLYSNSVPWDSKDMTAESVWLRTVAIAGDALWLLTQAIDTAAQVVETAGRLEPPPTVYYDLDTGQAALKA